MNVLITKKLSPADLELIQSWSWNYEVVEVLKITPVEVNEIPDADAWIVSSQNSFHAVKKFIRKTPDFIYCIGSWTKDQLMQAGAKSTIRSFENMKALVTDLKAQNFKTILYFCGEEHRPELEEGLKNTPLAIFKVTTHRSQMVYPVVKNNFEAVFVFSPRASESLLKHNEFSDQTVFACIGPTTASYLKGKGIINTFIPSHPDSRILLEEFHDQILKF